MRILILGNDALAEPLKRLGHEALVCGAAPESDFFLDRLDPDFRDISKIISQKGFEPQAVLVTDDIGRRQLPTGIWAAEAVTVFYGVDSPLNRFWQHPYARLFDAALLDQPDEVRELALVHKSAGWLPVAIDPDLYRGQADSPAQQGVCFVGVVNERVRPKRSAILQKVEKIAPLTVRGGRGDQWFHTGQAAELYRSYQVVLNENLFPGVTTRPLEVMAAGGCLLSEAAPGAMDIFFEDGKHLCYYDHCNFEDRLEQLLKDNVLREKLAAQGREEVFSNHGFEMRARKLVNIIKEISSKPIEERSRMNWGEALRLEGEALLMAGLRWPGQGGRSRILRAAPRLEAAAADGARLLPAARAAGLGMLVWGKSAPALKHLARAAEQGGAADHLAWALAAHGEGRVSQARQIIKGIPQINGEPGQSEFHIGAARLLVNDNKSLSCGFNRKALPACFWTGLEHLFEATRLEPASRRAWELMGDLLYEAGAFNQAHSVFQRALESSRDQELIQKAGRAAERGYLL